LAGEATARLTATEGRKFGLTVGIAFLALGCVWVWRGRPVVAAVAGALGGGLVLAGLIVPTRLDPVYRVWMRGAALISIVTTPLFMGVMYYLVLAPSGLLMRLLGSDPIRRSGDQPSYWVPRDKGRSDLRRQF
jgi:hypothetical protein